MSGDPIAAVKEVTCATAALGIADCYALLGTGELEDYSRILVSEEAIEEPKAFAEKRDPVWRGC